MLRDRGSMARTLAEWAIGEPFSADVQLRSRDQSYSEIEPPEYRADLVLEVAADGTQAPACMLVFEVQLSRDPRKRLVWPAYQAVLRSQHGCPTIVVVLAPDAGVARWCAEPIDLDGLGRSVMRPAVIGPSRVPLVTSLDEAARAPGMTALSVIAHGRSQHAVEVGRAGLRAAEVLDGTDSSLYADLVFHHLHEVARKALEHEMALKLKNKYEYQSSTAKRFLAEGKALGEVEGQLAGKRSALEAVLGARGLPLDEATRARLASFDEEQLDELIVRAATADSLDELFGS